MSILISIFSLCKKNNGYFKSQKQADFLIQQMQEHSGFIGNVSSGYHQCACFAEWDEKGITKVVKERKTKRGCKDEVIFTRLSDAEHQANLIKLEQQKERNEIRNEYFNKLCKFKHTYEVSSIKETIAQIEQRIEKGIENVLILRLATDELSRCKRFLQEVNELQKILIDARHAVEAAEKKGIDMSELKARIADYEIK